jgi:hypothetical protein
MGPGVLEDDRVPWETSTPANHLPPRSPCRTPFQISRSRCIHVHLWDFKQFQSESGWSKRSHKKNTQQLSQALKSGNLIGAQSDFTTLQAAFSQSASTSTSTATSPMAQALSQLGSDLYSGDISAAQEDLPPFSRISGVTARLRPTTSTLALTLAAAGKLPVLRT